MERKPLFNYLIQPKFTQVICIILSMSPALNSSGMWGASNVTGC